MPIRFRCPYCNQLLGISRRKAGTAVECPTCRGKVTVPATGLDDLGPGDRPVSSPLFEGTDFEAAFRGPAVEGPPAGTVPLFPFQPALAPSAFDVERVERPTALREPGPAPPAGLLLSRAQATFLAVAAVLLLALVFSAGLLVGRYVLN
jgi:hypothetical protein